MTKPQNSTLEIDLYPLLIEYFQNKGYQIQLEVPIHHNRIDMLVFNDDQTIAIELKLKNWKRALRQASYYQLGVDYSYIAMPFYQAVEVHKRSRALEDEGVGLFGVLLDRSEVRELLKPKKSQKKIDYMEQGLYSVIEKR
jgi:hypothetical protein